MNSGLQCIIATPPLLDYFLNRFESATVKKAAEAKQAEAAKKGEQQAASLALMGSLHEEARISAVFAPLLSDYWSGKFKYVTLFFV